MAHPASEGSGVADDGGLSAGYTRMPASEARQFARRLYGVSAAARRLEAEKDDTFRLKDAAGGRLIMKVSNPAEPRGEVDLQVALLRHVAQRDPSLPVPVVLPTLDGRAYAPVTDAAGQRRLVRMLTFIGGDPMDRCPSSPALRRHVGSVLARLRHAMVDFEHPTADRALAWDVQHLPQLARDVGVVPDPAHRAALDRGLTRFAAIAPALGELRRQVLHNDFSRSNLIVDAADHDRLAGVIDFGDAVRTAIAIDVSTALLNQLPQALSAEESHGDMFAAGRDLLSGYLAVADLTDRELELLPHLVMGRVIARAIITHRRAALFPDNATYIMRNTEQGWAHLAWFLARSPDAVSATFREAGTAHRSPTLEGQ